MQVRLATAVILKLECASESPTSLVETDLWAPPSVRLGQGLSMCISSKFPGGRHDAFGSEDTL